MVYQLYLGDPAYSSWSLRGWLLFHRFGIRAREHHVDFRAGSVAAQLADLAPARTVPAMVTPEGAVVSESLAIAEELASRHPGAGIWPEAAEARAVARNLAAEMHAGFVALREECPMNLRAAYGGYQPPEPVLADLRRLETILDHARSVCAGSGPWLCGEYSAADAFFAPVAARIAGYGLEVGDSARAYVAAHLADPAFRRWRAMGLVRGADLKRYARDHARGEWPGPRVMAARAVGGEAAERCENARCPHSGEAVREFMEIEGRVFGFCNRFCRDRTLADPGAWPGFMEIFQG